MKLMKFRVNIKNLDNKIWRIIEINDNNSLSDLAYVILASFDSLAYHSFSFIIKNNKYFAYDDEDIINLYKGNGFCSKNIELKKINLEVGDTFNMEYDSGSPTDFVITLIGEKNRVEENMLPYILDGDGHGMIDDISSYELEEIVKNIDKTGISNYQYTTGYERTDNYDYRDFDLKENNNHVENVYSLIKKGYDNID